MCDISHFIVAISTNYKIFSKKYVVINKKEQEVIFHSNHLTLKRYDYRNDNRTVIQFTELQINEIIAAIKIYRRK
jgi:hypothetical protein